MRHADAGYEIAIGVRARAGPEAADAGRWHEPPPRPAPPARSISTTSTIPTSRRASAERRRDRRGSEPGPRRAGPRRDDDRAARAHLRPEQDGSGHFNVLRGYVRPLAVAQASRSSATSVDNYEHGLPSELALLNLFDPTHRRADRRHRRERHHRHAHRRRHRDRRTRAGAQGSKVLGHIGARGTAYWNVRLLDRSVRVRRDPRPFAPARKAATRSARACARPAGANGRRHRRLGVVRARRRHRRRGVARCRSPSRC